MKKIVIDISQVFFSAGGEKEFDEVEFRKEINELVGFGENEVVITGYALIWVYLIALDELATIAERVFYRSPQGGEDILVCDNIWEV